MATREECTTEMYDILSSNESWYWDAYDYAKARDIKGLRQCCELLRSDNAGSDTWSGQSDADFGMIDWHDLAETLRGQ